MSQRTSKQPDKEALEREEYDRLAIELAASLKLYLRLLELGPFSPDVTGLIRQLAREIVRRTPPQDPPLH